ncbi:MAG: alanine racemase, partial [Oscillospiraceae bacterium]|nr:alanine racemase [Oscillospiraceae bacterium]
MTDFPTGRAWIELDREALGHNAAYLTSLLPPGCALMPAVKANAYGHGAVLVARELNALGIKAFWVASAAEGADLREHGVEGEILVLV